MVRQTEHPKERLNRNASARLAHVRRLNRKTANRKASTRNDFTKAIQEHIEERLEDYEGNSVYMCDLATELTMYENMNGAWIIGTYQALNFICDNRWEASDTFDYFKNELEMTPNPFDNPEAFTFYMLDWGVRQILAQCEFIDENWGDELELTAETISTITEQVKEVRSVN